MNLAVFALLAGPVILLSKENWNAWIMDLQTKTI
jgi:hypothetical protein